jgi:gliding motility-associated-like protein
MCVNLKGNEAGLIGYWDFNETEGNTVIDRSANHFNGTFKGNPLRVRSGAAIGDVSSYMYPTSSTTRSLSLVAGDQKIEVNNLSASVRGVQIYGVHSLPSNTTGLPANGVPTTYFGIFLAQQESSSSFSSKLTVDGDVPCSVFIREDNSSPSWKSSTPFNNNQKRVEVIQGPATNDVAFDLGPDLQLCNETQHEIRSGINPIDHTITWSTGETTPTIVAKKSGWYTVTAHADCTQAKDSIHVAFITPPGTFSLGNDVFTCQLQPIILTAPVSPSTDVTWDNGSETTTREITDFGTYWATLRNSCGSVSDTIHIKKLSVTYSVPNVITPNGDGLNDSFIISDDMDTPIVLEVFNRWGQRVFYSAAYDDRWSGSGVATGTYYYVLTDGCGAPKKGVLNILR